MSDFKISGMNFFDFSDFITNQIMLPLGGIFIAIFVGWVMKEQDVLEETGLTIAFGYKAWRIILRYVAPVLVAGVFIGYFI